VSIDPHVDPDKVLTALVERISAGGATPPDPDQ